MSDRTEQYLISGLTQYVEDI